MAETMRWGHRMKATTRSVFLGSILGGAIVQLTVLAGGKVASVPDAGAAVDTTVGSGDGTTLTFSGFSYHTDGFVKMTGWNPVIVDVLDYNTFTSASYNVQTGTF